MPKHSCSGSMWQSPDGLSAGDVQHACEALMWLGCQRAFGHTAVPAASKTALLRAVQANLTPVLISAAGANSLKVDFRGLNVDTTPKEWRMLWALRSSLIFWHLVTMNKGGSFLLSLW